MFHLKQVTKLYPVAGAKPVTAVDNLALLVNRGDFVVITGRSGSGKTTVINLLGGLTRPSAGTVELDSVDLWSLPDREQAALRNWRMGFVFQFPSLLPSLTALENVTLPLLFKASADQAQMTRQATKLLDLLGLADKLACFPRQLSAGQQQRVVIARALVNEPEILLADEPTSNLDEQTEAEILQTFERIHSLQSITMVIVTHSRYLGPRGTRQIEMAEGRMVRESRT